MKTIIFTLCDGAFNYDGRLTVVGTYDQMKMTSIPGNANANFALKFRVPVNELGQSATIRVEFQDMNDNPISDGISKSIAIPASDTGSIHLAMAGSVKLNVAEAGKHKMICYINDCQVEELVFSISSQ